MAIRHWRWLRIHDRETPLDQLIRLLNERLKKLSEFLSNVESAAPGIVEFYAWNEGAVLTAGESDWPYLSGDFTLTAGQIVTDPPGSLSFNLYHSTYGTWDTWVLVNPSPVTLTAVDKATLNLAGWTTSFAGGRYFKLVITAPATTITKATVSLEWSPA